MKLAIFSFVLAVIVACAFATQPDAPQKCPAHSRWNVCGTACPTTCKQQTPPPCTKQCHAACQCDGDRVWNDAHDECVLTSECPKTSTTSPKF